MMIGKLPSLGVIEPLDWSRRPEWLAVSEEQAAKAQRIIMPTFWESDDPFHQIGYQEIGFPFCVGSASAESRKAILLSEAFKRAAQKQFNREAITIGPYGDGSGLRQDELFLSTLCEQIVAIDYLIYRQPHVRLSASLDIAQLTPGQVHRGVWGITEGEQGFHVDLRLDNPIRAKNLARYIRLQKPFCGELIGMNDLKNATGAFRNYLVANAYPTVFQFSKPFAPWDIIHFIAEGHRSPVIPEPVLRAFLRVCIHPL